MKVNGRMISSMVKVSKFVQMVADMRDNSLMENQKELEPFAGQMVKFMKVNGRMASSMDQACGEVQKETLISVNGSMAKLMAMVCILGEMVRNREER